MIYLLSWILCFVLVRIYFDRRVYGVENIPAKGPFIFASNHDSYLDPVLLGTSVKCSRWFNYLAKKELFSTRLKEWYFRQIHALPLDREDGDLAAIKMVLRLLRSGRPLILFPEGTRSRGKGLQPAKPGLGFIVSKAMIPVVPAYIEGSYEAMPEGVSSIKKRSAINIFIGKPLYFTDARYNHKGGYQEISDQIMEKIADLKEANAGKTR